MIYDSPFFRALMFYFGWIIIKAGRWHVVGDVPDIKKFVAIAAPHTSNWDFPVFMAFVGYKKMAVRFLGKHTLFKGVMGPLFYWLGGIPVNRSSPLVAGVIEQAVSIFAEADALILGIAPEGTRSSVSKWKSGFYRIAVDANVPVVLVFLDAKTKKMGFGPVFHPTGDWDSDIVKIQQFYSDKTGINPAS